MCKSDLDRKFIENLKSQWVSDPCWDIEDTPGFESDREELLAFRKHKEEKWRQEAHDELQKAADKMGIPDNLVLAQYILKLEATITNLRNQILL